MSWISRMAKALRPDRTGTELADELQFHIDQRVDDLVAGGVPRGEAERMARRQFGSALRLSESSREVKSAVWFENFLGDFRFGLRMLRRSRTASLAAIASLGLAIGACTAAFALIDALILRPLPLAAPDQLIDLAHVMPAFFSPDNHARESNSFSYAQFELLRDRARDYADLFPMRLSGGFQPAVFDDAGGVTENIRAESISGRGFEILGVRPALGRLIEPADDAVGGGHPVAVLSHAFWKRRFGGSSAVLGHWVSIGKRNFQIVGVAAAPFAGVEPGYLTDVWLPLEAASDPRHLADPDYTALAVWGRLHTGVDAAQLHDPLQAAFTNFRRERARLNPPRMLHGDQLRQFTDAPLRVRDASRGGDSLFRLEFRRPLEILALICGLLLLIACSNVANLIEARASARETEMAIRVALGAGRFRLIQQMLIESGQMAAAAGFLAVWFAVVAAPAMVARLGTTEFPAWLNVAPDGRTFAFAAVSSLATALMVGLVPALRASSTAPAATLKSGGFAGTGRGGPMRWMLAAQIGFSVSVLFLSGLLLLSFRKLITVDLGFTPDHVVLFDLAARQPESHRRSAGTELLEHMRHLPGVRAASISAQRPMGGDLVWIMEPIIRLPGRANETVRPREVPVSAGFFNAMRIGWIAGRDFRPEEIAGDSPAVIVNQAFVDKFYKGQNPIGQTFLKLTDDPDPIRQQIIGVAGNARYNNPREPEGPTIYTPLRDAAGATLNVRTAARAQSLIPWLRKEIESAAPEMSVRGSILLSSQIDNTMIRERLLALLAGFFSVVALLLAGVGLYGVMNYAAVRRTREIGIRIALGARRAGVVRLMVTSTALPVIAGILLGVAGGLGLARYLSAQLFGIHATDFGSLAASLVSIIAAALAGVLPPAWRAAGADPRTALRHD